jgi:Protein of unknown function (DUF1592)/Protein of unknown function (DUF1588)/Protein of unknown function (DUF1587)/Protein of unknown function (DUF1595)/Protein of unknown function (DUF1585)
MSTGNGGTIGVGAGGAAGVSMLTPAQTAALCAAAVDPGPAFVRRMTHLEYDNTIRDLLGTPTTVGEQFPPEEVRLGFDNNAAALSVSPGLAEQYLDAAETLATAAVTTNMAALVSCDPTTKGVDVCGQQFIAAFGQRAYRRPVSASDAALLKTVFDAGKATDFATGVRLVIETILQSPQFLYRIEVGRAPAASDPSIAVTDGSAPNPTKVVRLDDWEMASRLSYLLWGSMPDDQLFAAAAAGKLSTEVDIAAQAQRMLKDPKAHDMVADFHSQWLGLDAISTVEKDPTVFKTFTPTIAGLMEQETKMFLDDVVWNENGTLATLFTAPYTFVNGPLAQYYGIAGVTGSAFVKTPLDGTQRLGMLTQGGFLSQQAKTNQTSPVHRGKFVREQFLCQQLPPPPPNLQIVPPSLSPTLTTRQRFAQHSAAAACSGCHSLMDPLGLGFETFDGAGLYRATENGQPIDASGQVANADTELAGPFNGAVELAKKLGGSSTVQACVTTQWFRYAYGRSETDADTCSMATLATKFAAGGYKMQDLLAALTQTKAFLYRRVTPAVGNVGNVGSAGGP